MPFAPHFVAAGLTKQVVFRLEHATFAENPNFGKKGEVRWLRTQGCPVSQGNYKLFYNVPMKPPFRLRLEVGDSHHQVDVSQVKNGMGIGIVDLQRFLNHVAFLGCWAPREVKCRVVVTKDRMDTASEWVAVRTPVEPWTKDPYNVEEFTRDPGIYYCGDLDKKVFYGRILKQIGDKYYFTFKDSLESNPDLRGFACIGLVGNAYRIPPGPAYQNGEDMAAAVGGTAFDGGGKREGRTVAMDRTQLLNFIKTGGQTGSYMIWTGGHAGLIRNGVLYECKPSGRGFTKEVFTTGSAVRKYDSERLSSELKNRGDTYFLSKLPR
jgi:hypothetical protein